MRIHLRIHLVVFLVSGALIAAWGFGMTSETTALAAGEKWYRVPLAHGNEEGFLWGFSAKGPKDRSLKRICGTLVTVAPPEPGTDYVEATETSACGRLLRANDSISMSVLLGSGEVETLLATLYPRDVRKVTYLLVSGGERTYRAKGVKVAERVAKRIPYFRYVAAQFDADSCIVRTITYGGQGEIIRNEKGEKACPQGS